MSVKLPGFLHPRFNLIGHRGVHSLAPENTLASFRLAAQLGLNWIEFDTQPTKDEEWVVIHDATCQRTTNGKGLISELNFAEIRTLDAGSWFSYEFKEEKIPTLQEVITLGRTCDLQLNIEVKLEPEIILAETAFNSFIAILKEYLSPLYPPPLISSFNIDFLKRLKTRMPELALGLLVEHFSLEAVELVEQFSFSTLNCSHGTFTPQNLEYLHSKQIPTLLFTVNDLETAHFWIEKGIYALFTDVPQLLLPHLRF